MLAPPPSAAAANAVPAAARERKDGCQHHSVRIVSAGSTQQPQPNRPLEMKTQACQLAGRAQRAGHERPPGSEYMLPAKTLIRMDPGIMKDCGQGQAETGHS